MRVTETEKTYGTRRLTNYKTIREKYLYHYIAVITKNQAINTNISGPSSDRYEHNTAKKSDKTQQVGTEDLMTQQVANKENKILHEKPESIISAKNINICPRCLVNPKMMCVHCKKKLPHDKNASILQYEPQRSQRKYNSDACEQNSCKLVQLHQVPSDRTITTSTRLSITSDSKDETLKNYQRLLESELKQIWSIQTISDDSYYFFTEWDKHYKKPKWIQCTKKLMPPLGINKLETRSQPKPTCEEEKPIKQEQKMLVEKIPKSELDNLLKCQSTAIKKQKLKKNKIQKQGERAMQAVIVKPVKDFNDTEESNSSTILSCKVVESMVDKMIIGERIVKRPTKKTTALPIPFKPIAKKHKPKKEYQISDQRSQPLRTECGILYALSDDRYIDNGWTILPREKMLRKMNVYRMYPAQPEYDWFEQNKWRGYMTYDTGDKFAEFEEDGRCRIYYKNGRLALDYYATEEANAKQRIVVYSNGEPSKNGRAHPVTVLAIFDYLGNGIVLDHCGNPRLKYNQSEGVVLDHTVGPASTWQWHSLNEPPELRHIMIDNHLPSKDPVILELGGSDDDEPERDKYMEAIELDNYAKQKARKLERNHSSFQIKMKALKINENFSLKILDQKRIYLSFRDGSVNIKLRIGMVLDHSQIIDTDIAELGVVSNNVERFTAATDSVLALRSTIKRAQQYEMNRLGREQWLRPSALRESTNRITAGLSHGLHGVPLKQSLGSIESCACSFVSQC